MTSKSDDLESVGWSGVEVSVVSCDESESACGVLYGPDCEVHSVGW